MKTARTFIYRAARSQGAFTMMEIAIALGVIAVALIAIMGVLPVGLQVQSSNREETIINQDGAYLLDAIRTSSLDVPDLVSYIDWVDTTNNPAINSTELIRILTMPNERHETVFRSISGPAAQRGHEISFRYKLISTVTNIGNANPDLPYAEHLTNNLWEVRLVFLWPLVPSPNGPPRVADIANRHVLRTLISGRYDFTNSLFILSEYEP